MVSLVIFRLQILQITSNINSLIKVESIQNMPFCVIREMKPCGKSHAAYSIGLVLLHVESMSRRVALPALYCTNPAPLEKAYYHN